MASLAPRSTPLPAPGAVFLSYASQDAVAARRICDALRAAGVEVWFDQSELVGGDAWDVKIKKQIRDCALFLPVISATTQARREGYFRLEWKLAAQRTHMMADGTPFVLPIVLDATHDADALVPEEFRSVQWTRLPGGDTSPAFVQRVRALGVEFSERPLSGPGGRDPVPPASGNMSLREPAAPASGPPPSAPAFRFAGRDYRDAVQLAAGLVRSWQEAANRWADGSILAWISQHARDEPMVSRLRAIAVAEKLDGPQQLAVALLALSPTLPLFWQGEVVTDEWMTARPELAARLCDSAVPHWLKELRGEDWLWDRAAHRATLLKELTGIGFEVDRAQVDRQIFRPMEAIVEDVRALVEQFPRSQEPVIDALLQQEDLSLAEAIVLLAAPREIFLPAGAESSQPRARRSAADEGGTGPVPAAPGRDDLTAIFGADGGGEYFDELRCLQGHAGPVQSVAFSPGMRWVASGSSDASIIAWDPHTGLEFRRLAGHSAAVQSVAFSPDGHCLASGSADASVRFWETNIGHELRRMNGHKASVRSVVFSPDGRQLVSGGADNCIVLCDVWSGQERLRLTGHDDWVSGVAFSPDGHRVASSSADGSVRLWDAESGREVRRFDGHAGTVHGVAFSPDGRCLASCGVDGTLRLWDLKSGREQRRLTGHSGAVHCAAFSPVKPWLASGSADHTLRLWDTNTGRELQRLESHTGVVRCVAFNQDGRRLASGSFDKSVRIWSLITGGSLGQPGVKPPLSGRATG
jgi:WD40 repeat protein